jgi:ribosomal-protein-alanine N-acetyltransferase
MSVPSRRLDTERLFVDPYSQAYVTPAYVGWLNDPEVVKYSENRYRTFTLEGCVDYVASFEGSSNYLWAIVRKDTGQHIGNINAYVDVPNKLADVGIMVGERSCWGGGYGLEAWKAVCSWLLTDGGMRKVTAGTLDTNIGMKRIMEKSGMTPDGRRVRQYLNAGAEVDVVYAALFAAP